MTAPDWLILAIYLAAILFIAFYFRARASRGIEEFFIADRKLPWWVIGFADVASYTGGGPGVHHRFLSLGLRRHVAHGLG